ncbi:hypothetical protein R3P38DRAFT_2560217 [Favolaschia claudopus]|uniref:Zn(2)-C6 fungal-type domain-containing protein n=1 Tax=Favolaschia claudopus TaxID=2862362 RepID=A0AAW0A4V4_9AGAR
MDIPDPTPVTTSDIWHAAPEHETPAHSPNRVQHQLLLTGGHAPKPTTSRAKKRCARCVKHDCPRRQDCPGKGGQKFCTCPHPALGSGEKVRKSEKDIATRRARAA